MPDSRDLSVVFDLDGTLLETQEIIPQSLREFGAARDLDFSGLTWLGCGLAEVVDEIFRNTGRRFAVEDLRAYMHPRQKSLMEEAAADDRACPPGLSQLVDGLFKKRVPFGVATLSPRKRALALLGAAGLGDTFPDEVLVCQGDVEFPKPAPDALHLAAWEARTLKAWAAGGPLPERVDPGAAETMRAVNAAAVMVGDSQEDMAAARAAGMFAVGRVHSVNDEEGLRAAGAHLVVEDYRQLTVERLMELVEKGE